MTRILHFFLIGALGVFTATCAPPDPSSSDPGPAPQQVAPRQQGSTTPRIVFLGDSLTAGLGLPRDESVPSRIQERLNSEGYRYEVVNAGVSGDTSAGGLNRLDWSLEGNVDILVIELGANDGLRGLPVTQLRRNLNEIITRAKRRNIIVILTGMEAPPNYGSAYTSEFRRVFRDLAEEHSVSFIPFYLDGVAGISRLNQADGIHPNVAGSQIIEQTVWKALEPVLEK